MEGTKVENEKLNKLSVVIVDDHKLFLEGISILLEKMFNVQIVSFNESNFKIIDYIRKNVVDILISDINMPNWSGFELTEQIRKESKMIKILLVSVRNDRSIFHKCKSIGANGYVCKSSDFNEFSFAIQAILNNRDYFDISYENLKNKRIEIHFTKRELEVLKLLVEGKSIKEVAAKLMVAPSTIISHKKNLFEKTAVRSLVELTNYSISKGLIA